MFREVKLPRGQRLLRVEESLDGMRVALAQVSPQLYATYDVTPAGFVDGPTYAGTRQLGNGQFDARLASVAA
ncbi:MAG: hypothetical protein U9R73_00590 [Pseudomonadota bacterium]|nr:hypothetical protein [Pseudomonadota bacterium]